MGSLASAFLRARRDFRMFWCTLELSDYKTIDIKL